eukprot:COSAG01_NODE_2372_length_7810_cov_5.360135_6_plen_216_part_00
MDALAFLRLNMDFLFSGLLATLVGGLLSYLLPYSLLLKRFFFLAIFVFSAVAYFISILAQKSSPEVLLQCLGLLFIALALLSLGLSRLQNMMLFWQGQFLLVLAIFFGALIGAGQPLLVVIALAFFLLVLLLYKRVSNPLLSVKSYQLILDFQSPDLLLTLDDMIRAFDLSMTQRDLQKKGRYHLHLRYETTALVQHLFLKKVCQLKGVQSLAKF